MEGQADSITPARPPIDMKPSPALSLIKKAKPTLKGRKVGVLVTDGTGATDSRPTAASGHAKRNGVLVMAAP